MQRSFQLFVPCTTSSQQVHVLTDSIIDTFFSPYNTTQTELQTKQSSDEHKSRLHYSNC